MQCLPLLLRRRQLLLLLLRRRRRRLLLPASPLSTKVLVLELLSLLLFGPLVAPRRM